MFHSISRILRTRLVNEANDADKQCSQAEALRNSGAQAEAVAMYEAILAKTPGHWRALTGFAALSLQVGDPRKAIALYDAALRQRPEYAEGYYKRANAHNRLNELDLALAGYDEAVACDPKYAYAYCNRGTVLEKLGRLSEALSSYDQAIALNPGDALAHFNRASALKALGRRSEALGSYDQALALNSAYLEACINRGLVLQELMRYNEALLSFDKALSLNAGYVGAWEGRGNCLLSLRRLPEAIASFDKALNLNPEQPYLRGLRQYARMQICDWTHLATEQRAIEAGLRAGQRVTTPFATLSLFNSPELHRRSAQIWVADVCTAKACLDAIGRRQATGKVRIGYFSPDFRIHPVSSLMIGVLERHDRSQFEVVGFDFGPLDRDNMHERLRNTFDRFEDVRGLSDRDIALLARRLEIDVAVDLAGYTEHNRASIFSFRAAPVQIGYLGYPGTTANAELDYILADQQVAPPKLRDSYTETVVYLPNCLLPVPKVQAVAPPSRLSLGLPASGFVFCCFNNAYKITPAVFDSWMRILGRVAASVLWLSSMNEHASRNLCGEAVRRGIDPARLIFAARTVSHADHLARIRAADLFLDTSPYSAHVTALDALSAGVPVLTCPGDSFASRIPASLLIAFGVPELIADSETVYEDLAVEFASDRNRLDICTRKLQRIENSARSLDMDLYVRDLEEVYRNLVRASVPPSSF